VSEIQLETPAGSQDKVDTHNVDGAAHADIRALVSVTPDATSSVKGKVQLAGDLGGTAASPTVPGLASKADASATTAALAGKAADSAVVHNTGNETVAGIKTFSSSPIVPTPTTGTQAVNKTYADGLVSGGAPDATTGSKGIVQLAGDLGGTAASPTVPGLAGKQATNQGLTDISGLSPSNDDILQRKAGAWTNRTPAQVKTDLALAKADVGLGLVDNTSNATERAATRTLTNARITKRVGTTASSSTPTADADNHDGYTVTAAAANMTVGAPTGTPTEFQMILYRFKDNGTARTIAWNAAFRAVGITLPTTTVISKTLYVLTVWNAADSKWDALATGQEA
jgi:hypothetical protein